MTSISGSTLVRDVQKTRPVPEAQKWARWISFWLQQLLDRMSQKNLAILKQILTRWQIKVKFVDCIWYNMLVYSCIYCRCAAHVYLLTGSDRYRANICKYMRMNYFSVMRFKQQATCQCRVIRNPPRENQCCALFCLFCVFNTFLLRDSLVNSIWNLTFKEPISRKRNSQMVTM